MLALGGRLDALDARSTEALDARSMEALLAATSPPPPPPSPAPTMPLASAFTLPSSTDAELGSPPIMPITPCCGDALCPGRGMLARSTDVELGSACMAYPPPLVASVGMLALSTEVELGSLSGPCPLKPPTPSGGSWVVLLVTLALPALMLLRSGMGCWGRSRCSMDDESERVAAGGVLAGRGMGRVMSMLLRAEPGLEELVGRWCMGLPGACGTYMGNIW